MFTNENFIKGLKLIFNQYDILINQENISFNVVEELEGLTISEEKFSLPLKDINDLLENLQSTSKFSNYSLIESNRAEVGVKVINRSAFILHHRFEHNNYLAENMETKLYLSLPSNRYIIALICNIGVEGIKNDIMRIRAYHTRSITSIEELSKIFGISCVNIDYQTNISNALILKLTRSYLFNISYNYDITLELLSEEDNRGLDRNHRRLSGQLFPFKEYNVELLNYYKQAQTSEMPVLQYLAYYHIIEFFYLSISEQNMFEQIKQQVASPMFSANNEESLKLLYQTFKKISKTQKEEDVWDERNALLLCLKKFVSDLSLLKSAINSIQTNALNYYKENEVSFADEAKAINWNLQDNDIYTLIRNRIYSVRNAIVHSKDGEKSRYKPFKHDKELNKEIPLIRAVAEFVIIYSAKDIKI